MNGTDFWKRKLLAFLHDPPEKAYDYSLVHSQRAMHYAQRIGINLSEWQDKLPDHAAAAADRFIFPATKRKEGDRWVDTGVPGLGNGPQFIHPLSGVKVPPEIPRFPSRLHMGTPGRFGEETSQGRSPIARVHQSFSDRGLHCPTGRLTYADLSY
jgi:hypothetical protein